MACGSRRVNGVCGSVEATAEPDARHSPDFVGSKKVLSATRAIREGGGNGSVRHSGARTDTDWAEAECVTAWGDYERWPRLPPRCVKV